MKLDENILLKIIEIHNASKLDFILHIGGKIFPLKNVEITKTPTPVNQPTTRGGVYFSDKYVFKIKSQLSDLSIVPLLSKSMLGPNTDFQDLEIVTHTELENSLNKITFFGHLTNYMRSTSYIELNMELIKIESE